MGRATIQLGGRKIKVDTDPLPGGGANFQTHALVELRDGQLVLRPSLGFRLVAAVFVAVGCVPLAIAGFMWSAHGRDTGVLVLVGFGVLFTAAGLLTFLLPRRHTFDTAAGTWTTRGLFGRSERPLADVLAVQLIQGGWHTARGGPHQAPSTYFTYQLNLILDDDQTPRRNLLDHGHWDSIAAAADRLADVLGVPLQDLAADGE